MVKYEEWNTRSQVEKQTERLTELGKLVGAIIVPIHNETYNMGE